MVAAIVARNMSKEKGPKTHGEQALPAHQAGLKTKATHIHKRLEPASPTIRDATKKADL